MTNFVIIEVQVWLLLLLFLLLVGLLVGAYFYWRKWLRSHDAKLRDDVSSETAHDSMVRRNRMLIRLDHELKNPLTALRTNAATVRQLIQEPVIAHGELEAVGEAINTSSRRVARLLADLRKLADIETRHIEFARIDMDFLVQQAVEDVRTAPGAEGRTIVATVAKAPWRLPDVAGEEDLLLSAVMNLLSNAIKYSAPADIVELRANEQIIKNFRWVVVEVADTGRGIPLAEQDGVWDELSRGQGVRAVSGSGMGLALVRSIVERHGGRVEMFSQENVGTAVRMILPVLGDAQNAVAPDLANQPNPLSGPMGGASPVQPFQDDRERFGPPEHAWSPPRLPASPQGAPGYQPYQVPPYNGQPVGSGPTGYGQRAPGQSTGSAPHPLSAGPYASNPAADSLQQDTQVASSVHHDQPAPPQASAGSSSSDDPGKLMGSPRRTSRRRHTSGPDDSAGRGPLESGPVDSGQAGSAPGKNDEHPRKGFTGYTGEQP